MEIKENKKLKTFTYVNYLYLWRRVKNLRNLSNILAKNTVGKISDYCFSPMRTSQSNLDIKKTVQVPSAQLYFMDNLVIVEVRADEILGKNEVIPILDAVDEEFGDRIDIHYISNRTEVYSLRPTDFIELQERINKFQSYSVVVYGEVGETNLIFERMFLKKEIIRYSNLLEAVNAVQGIPESANSSSSVA